MNTLMMITDINHIFCNFRGLTGEEIPEECGFGLNEGGDDMLVIQLHPKSYSVLGSCRSSEIHETINDSLPESTSSDGDFFENDGLLSLDDPEYLEAYEKWLQEQSENFYIFSDYPKITKVSETRKGQSSLQQISPKKGRRDLYSIERRICWGRSHGKRGGKRQKKFSHEIPPIAQI
jgi:hypothetical protein